MSPGSQLEDRSWRLVTAMFVLLFRFTALVFTMCLVTVSDIGIVMVFDVHTSYEGRNEHVVWNFRSFILHYSKYSIRNKMLFKLKTKWMEVCLQKCPSIWIIFNGYRMWCLAGVCLCVPKPPECSSHHPATTHHLGDGGDGGWRSR